MAQARERQVVVIGCGAIGLPLAAAFASRGVAVLGIDSDAGKAADLGAGRTDLVEAGLDAALNQGLASGRLAFAEILAPAGHARAYIVAVPTPASSHGGFDAAPVERALADITAVARAGELVCLRSTLPIGAARALAARHPDLAFAACPDRSVAGSAYAEQFSIPHIVGGLGAAAGARAEALFAPLGAVVRTPDPETAEAIKLFANAQRDVSFALANQFALICEATGVDFTAVREAGAAGFPRFSLARPGPVGGPCLTKDLMLLLASGGVAEVDTGLLTAARALNESLAARIAEAVEAELAGRTRAVAILGLAFKGRPPTADRRGAFAGDLIEQLRRRLAGLDIRRWDPVAGTRDGRADAVAGAAVVVLANDHPDLAVDLQAELAPDAVVFDVAGLIPAGAQLRARRFGDGTR